MSPSLSRPGRSLPPSHGPPPSQRVRPMHRESLCILDQAARQFEGLIFATVVLRHTIVPPYIIQHVRMRVKSLLAWLVPPDPTQTSHRARIAHHKEYVRIAPPKNDSSAIAVLSVLPSRSRMEDANIIYEPVFTIMSTQLQRVNTVQSTCLGQTKGLCTPWS